MAIINKDGKYKWEFVTIGGATRVKITSGKDIAHLAELDPKMWTVLSCPVKGLEIDEKSLAYVDCDGDGKIRVNDVVLLQSGLPDLSRMLMSSLTDRIHSILNSSIRRILTV